MLKNRIIFLILTAIFLPVFICTNAFAKNVSANIKLNIIDTYQNRYFETVKRNDVLLNLENTDKLIADRVALIKLFTETEKMVTNQRYLKKYKKIQKRFSECAGTTTIDINVCAEENYKAIDKLLNDVYKKAESKLNFEDGKKLASSELQWEKDVENYKAVFDSMGFGTIGVSIYLGYEINMREFRTLLLMLFL